MRDEEIGEYRPAARGDVVRQAQSAFIYALARLQPYFDKSLTERLERIDERDRIPPRIEQEIYSWGKERGLPLELVLDGVEGFRHLDPVPFFEGMHDASGWGGPIAEYWDPAEFNDPDDRPLSSADFEFIDFSFRSGPFEYQHPGADLTVRNLPSLLSDIRQEVEEALRIWAERIEERAMEAGCVRNTKPRDRDHGEQRSRHAPGSPLWQEISPHFEWLVRYQYGPESYDDIAKDVLGATRAAVTAAVQKAARQTGVALRGLSKGGPKELTDDLLKGADNT